MITQSSKRWALKRRAGAWTLSLLGTSPNPVVLRAVAAGPRRLSELRGAVDVSGSTLRARLRCLEEAGILTSDRTALPRSAVSYELTPAGRGLVPVIDALERWLAAAPGGGRSLAGPGARAPISALCEGWSAALLRPLASQPLSVADLDQLVSRLSYPAIERRIAAMRDVGQVEAISGGGRETPYALMPWMRRAAALLLAAVHWERLHLGRVDGPAPGRIEFETLLLLATPLLKLDDAASGVCRLAVELPNKGNGNGDSRLAGVLVELREGAVASYSSRLDGGVADAWAVGLPGAWLRGLIDGDCGSLEFGGDGRLARAVLAALHRSLFDISATVATPPSGGVQLRR